MEGLTFRKATPEDAERIAEIVAGEPGRERIGLAGDVDRARAIGMVIARMEGMPAGPPPAGDPHLWPPGPAKAHPPPQGEGAPGHGPAGRRLQHLGAARAPG